MKKIKLSPSGKEVNCPDNETVLSVLEKNGYALPNNCRAGACGECKIKVLSGEFDQGFVLDMALPQEDRDKGYGLMCMAKVKSDILEIEYASEDAKPKLFPPRENMPFIVTEKWQVTPSILKLHLRSLGESLRFWPGQYIQLCDEQETIPKRCYSIANIPNSDGEIILHITKVSGGKLTPWAHEVLKIGQTVKLSGPYGSFIGDPSVDTPVLCLAAGSGLAPITSLASAAMLRGGFKKAATVLFSASTQEDVYEKGLFSYLMKKFRNFEFKYTLTKQSNPQGLEGRIPTLLPKLYPNLENYSIYIAGGVDFVSNCKEKVIELGAKENLIHVESYFSQNTELKG